MHRNALLSFTLLALAFAGGCKSGGEESRTPGKTPTSVSRTPVKATSGTITPEVDVGTETSLAPEDVYGPPIPDAMLAAEVVVPDFSGSPHEETCEADHLGVGQGLVDAQMFSEAMVELERGVFDDPESFEVRRTLGELYMERGLLEHAVGHLRAAVEQVDDAATMGLLAQSYYDLKDFGAAIKVIERQRKIDPTNPEPYRLLAKVYLSKSMWKEAVEAGEEAIARGSDSPWTYNNMGFAQLILGNYEDAIRELEKAVSFDEEVTPQIWNNLGLAYEKGGRIVDASAAYRSALAANPTYVKAKVNLDRTVTVAKEMGIAVGERKAEVDFGTLPVAEETGETGDTGDTGETGLVEDGIVGGSLED